MSPDYWPMIRYHHRRGDSAVKRELTESMTVDFKSLPLEPLVYKPRGVYFQLFKMYIPVTTPPPAPGVAVRYTFRPKDTAVNAVANTWSATSI